MELNETVSKYFEHEAKAEFDDKIKASQEDNGRVYVKAINDNYDDRFVGIYKMLSIDLSKLDESLLTTDGKSINLSDLYEFPSLFKEITNYDELKEKYVDIYVNIHMNKAVHKLLDLIKE